MLVGTMDDGNSKNGENKQNRETDDQILEAMAEDKGWEASRGEVIDPFARKDSIVRTPPDMSKIKDIGQERLY